MSTPPPRPARIPSALPSVLVAVLAVQRQFGISFQHTLAEIVSLNAGVSLPANVFKPGNP